MKAASSHWLKGTHVDEKKHENADATEARRELHWLPIRQRVTFKLATITYKARRSSRRTF